MRQGTLSNESPPKAASVIELAVLLGVARSSVYRWKASHDDTPQPDKEGRHDVEAWRSYIRAKGLNQSNHSADEESEALTAWRAEKVRLECERIEIMNGKLAGTLMEASEVEAGMSALLSGLRQAINNVPGRMADKVLHLADHHEAEEIITEEMNVLLRTILKCDFLDSVMPPKQMLS